MPATMLDRRVTLSDTEQAKLSSRVLSAHVRRPGLVSLRLDGEDEPILVPASALAFLVEILERMAKGDDVTLLSSTAELTTQEAASLLNVSRPYLIGLLDKGAIPHRKVGTHRRLAAKEVLAYKEREAEARHKALDELAAQAQALEMGY